jgi:acetyl esterase/lipase
MRTLSTPSASARRARQQYASRLQVRPPQRLAAHMFPSCTIKTCMSDEILSLPAPSADARFIYGQDANQFIDLRLPKPGKEEKRTPARLPLVINIHGGFWRAEYSSEHAGHFCAELTRKGLVTANLEYRRVGNKGGSWPGTFADIRSAVQFLRQNSIQYNFDAQKYLVVGHSAGGQLALCLAAHEPSVSHVISLAGVVDLQRAYQLHLSNDAVVEFLGGTPMEVPHHYREADPMQLSIPKARQWLIHGTIDDIVPPDLTRNYVAAKQNRTGKDREDIHFLEIAHAGHFDLIDPRSAAWKHVEGTILQLLS